MKIHKLSSFGQLPILICAFCLVLSLTYAIGYCAYRFLRFDYGSAIYETAAIFGALAVIWLRAISQKGCFETSDYWLLIIFCLISESVVTLALLKMTKSLGFDMYSQLLILRLPMHAVFYIFLFSDKRMKKVINSQLAVSTDA